MARLFTAALFLALVATIAHADSPQTGTIDGSVVDASGAGIPGVTVTLGSDRGDRSAITDENGKFLFGLVPPGGYTLSARLEGFEGAETPVRLETGARQTVSLRLGLGTAEEIAVVAEVPLVDKYQVSASTTLEAGVAKELVFANRNYQAVITSLPGVVHSDQSTQLAELMPSVNGGLWQENAAFVDGVDTTNTRYGGGSRIILPTSALSEVRSDAAGYGAEYGRVVGGVTGVVTKSGTNSFHGDFLYIAQNQKWEAQSDDVPLPREDEILSSYEASIGGPIVRDKAWFFAAGSDNTTNQLSSLAGGEIIDNSVTGESYIGKINFSPNARHSLVVTAIDAPSEVPFFATVYAERATVSNHDLGGSFETAAWNWAASDNKFLEVRAAHQTSSEGRTQIEFPTITPGASPDDPAGNQSAYWDLQSTLRWHASALPLGPGVLDFPRDQANVSLNWFLDRNELKLGVDYQDVSWESRNVPPDRYLGRGYNPSLPGGFVTPQLKRVFRHIDQPLETKSDNVAFFAQDRIEVGDHWTFTVGLRYEDQSHEDNAGTEVLSSEDLTPRLAAVYDVAADGRLLVKATAGRYLTQVTQELVNAEFSTESNGANAFDEYRWNPASLRYDIFNRTQLPGSTTRVSDLEPYYKDEVTAGVEWQMSKLWALDARAIYWKVDEPYSATDQFNAQGQVYRLLSNFSSAEREYRGLQIEANRAFRKGWVVRTNYTLSRVEGNTMGQEHFNNTIDDYLEAMAVLDAATGLPVTAVNRYGRLDHDRKHIGNVSAAKSFEISDRQRFTIGGWFTYRSGKPWGLRPAASLTAPGGTAVIQTTRYAEPRDAHELPDVYSLNLTGAWEFPIAGRVSGSLRAEMANVTDEQEQIAVVLATGRPILVRQSFQKPRELRMLAGIRF